MDDDQKLDGMIPEAHLKRRARFYELSLDERVALLAEKPG